MSVEGQSERLLKGVVVYQIALWFLLPLVGLIGLVAYQILGRGEISTPPPTSGAESEENYLSQARSALAKQSDLATCRSVVQMLNAHLLKSPEQAVTPLPSADGKKLQSLLSLDAEDLAEVNSPTFTPLDAHHLEACMMLREAAKSLETQPVEANGKTIRQTPLERAAAAFSWACRQVRLEVPGLEALSAEPAPNTQVLRLGRGGPIERALTFLAILEQFGLEDDDQAGLQGCLILTRDEKGPTNIWACGVAIGGKPDTLYLFDPRLGIPIPGPGGKGIATLAEAQKDPSVLGQLKIDKLTYDVTPQAAKRVTLSLVCPLSSAAPRMHLLQDKLLRDRTWRNQAMPAGIRVRLAEDPERAKATLQQAAKSAEGVEVTFTPRGAGILRRFLTKDDGGSDVPAPFELNRLPGFTQPDDPARANFTRQQAFQFQAVPWTDLPTEFKAYKEVQPGGPIGDRLRLMYMTPFLRPLVDPTSARELMLRGRHSRAVTELVQELNHWQAIRAKQRDAGDQRVAFEAWVRRAFPAIAAMLRAKGTTDERAAAAEFEAMWKGRDAQPVEILTLGSIAGPRGAEVMYQLALCRHEQALRFQARADLAAKAGLPPGSDASNARKTWIDAEGYWKEYLENNAGRPGVSSARRLRAEAQLMLGQREDAVKSLQDTAGQMIELERLANLFLAKQAAASKGG